MEETELGKRIKYLRDVVLGLSQDVFAQRIHRDRSTIAKIESGKMILTAAMRQSICAEFNVAVDWIETGNGEIFTNGVRESLSPYKHSFATPPRHPAAALIPLPSENTPGVDPCIQAMADVKEIFDSGDPILIPAIQANLHAFKRALLRERQFAQVLEENKDLRNRMQNLENLCKDIPDLRKEFETIKAENFILHTENNRLKSTYEAPDGSNGYPTYSEKQDVK